MVAIQSVKYRDYFVGDVNVMLCVWHDAVLRLRLRWDENVDDG